MIYKEIVYLKDDMRRMEAITRFSQVHHYEVVSHAIMPNGDYSVIFRKEVG